MNKLNKIEQNSTFPDIEVVNNETGLTPIQERAIILLVSGKNITDVSNELNIDRGTLYNWFDRIAVKAYYNRLCNEIKENIQNGLLGMYNEAIQAIGDSLKSDNETIKLKTAVWLIEQFKGLTIGETNPKQMIKNACMETTTDVDWGISLNESKYKLLLKENGLKA